MKGVNLGRILPFMDHPSCVQLEGIHCAISIQRMTPTVIVVTISGSDVGELAEAPFRELDRVIRSAERIRLFIDARNSFGASIDVSKDWAVWLGNHREHLQSVTMFTSSRLIRITANFVRRFAKLEDAMYITSDEALFEAALENALLDAPLPR